MSGAFVSSHCYFIGTSLRRDAISSHFLAIGQELMKRGHQTVIIAPPGHSPPHFTSDGLQILSWPSKRPTRMTDALFLWRLINRHEPDCLIANFATVNWMCALGWVSRVACRIAWYHTLSTQIDSDTNLSPHRRRMLRFRKRFIYGCATHLVTNSQAALEDSCRTFGIPREKCKVWRNSLADPARSLELRAGANREDVLVCAGRFDRTKGQDVLIDAIGLCGGELSSTVIEFLGSGPTLDLVRHKVSQQGLWKHCAFRGTVSHEEVLRRMSCAKLTVVPSRAEAFGLVNIESMSMGTPVIASRVDGIQEIVRDGIDGYLVPPDDPAALAEKLVALLQNPTLRQEMGQSARSRFTTVYEQSKVVSSLADWLEKITPPLSRSPERPYTALSVHGNRG